MTTLADENGNTIFKWIATISDEAASNATEASIDWKDNVIPAVRYDANGGKGTIADLLFIDETGNLVSKQISDNLDETGNQIIIKSGYTFMGWNTKWNGTGTTFKAGEAVTPQ